jgi:hypothetical protein
MHAQIHTAADQLHFSPGEPITGTVSWGPDSAFQAAHLRLLWFTSGKGDRDIGIAQELPLDSPASGGTRSFHFVAPDHPPSFSGRLISLEWALELAISPDGPISTTTITIAPDARELDLSKFLPDEISQPQNKAANLMKNLLTPSTKNHT